MSLVYIFYDPCINLEKSKLLTIINYCAEPPEGYSTHAQIIELGTKIIQLRTEVRSYTTGWDK